VRLLAAKLLNTKKKKRQKSSAKEVMGNENKGFKGQQTVGRKIEKRIM